MKKGNKKIKRLGFIGIPAFALILAFIVLYSGILSGGKFTTVLAKDLMKSIKEEKVDTVELKDEFIQSTADFSVDLLRTHIPRGKIH